MKSSTSSLLLILSLSLLPLLSSARPCKTLFISYYTITTTTTSSTDDETSSSSAVLTSSSPSRYFAVYRVVSFFPRRSGSHLLRSSSSSQPSSPLASSLRERAKDILIVVAGLLFGAGCGAVTAATMYIVYTLIANRHEICGSVEDWDDSEEEEEVESPKKMGYVMIAEPVKEEAEAKPAVVV